jgi:hypothetical protein
LDFVKQQEEPYREDYPKIFESLIRRPIDPITDRYLKKLKEKNLITNDILSYSTEVDSGRKLMKKKKIVVAGLVYNAEKLVPGLEKWFNDLQKLCKECHIVIVENNSKDNTREKLKLWKKRSPKKVHLVCEESECKSFEYIDPTLLKSGHKSRIEKMSYLRNMYVKYIRKNFKDIDYVFVMDFDLDGMLYWDGVFHSLFKFYINPDIEMIACNGVVNGSFSYYDTFAYAKDKNEIRWSSPFDKATHDQDVLQNISRHYQENLEMDRVSSAFGGFSMYVFDNFIKHEYNFQDKTYSCEHCLFHENFKNLQVNPRMIYIIFDNTT